MPSVVVLAERQLLLHEAMKLIVQQQSDMVMVATTNEPAQLQRHLQQHQPDLLLLSSNMLLPTPAESLPILRQQFPHTRLLLLLEHGSEGCPCELVQAGTTGCIVKTEPPHAFVEAMRVVAVGQSWHSQEVTQHLLQHQANALTVRERAVLLLVMQEKTDAQIAQALNLSDRTIRCHLESLYKKLNAQTRVGAVVQAIKRGLIRP